MKQRLAFILCGQPRYIHLYEEYMSKLKFEFDTEIDFFFHFWGDHQNESVYKLKPKKYIFEPQIDFNSYIETLDTKNKNIDKYRPIFNYISYSYSTKKAFELKDEYEKENNFEYDLVFRVRFDFFMLQSLVFKKERLDLYKNNFFSMDNTRFILELNHPRKIFGIGDLFNFSSSKIMRVFNNLYSDIKPALNDVNNNWIQSSRDKHYCGESFLAYSFLKFANESNLNNINLYTMNIAFLLKRENNYKITQDFVYNFTNQPQPTLIV